jgi:hypothetical protein
MGLCLATAGTVVKTYAAVTAFTLAWTHSVQKTEWQEDWRVAEDKLVIAEARVQGTGAGMEPPPEARFDGIWWRWKPSTPPMKEVALRRSGATADWQLCIDGTCRALGDIVSQDADPVLLRVCEDRR